MIADHSHAQLGALANERQVPLPDTLNTEDRQVFERLSTLHGYQFDSAYIHQMVMDHRETRDLYQNYLQNSGDLEIAEYANSTRPFILIHLERAERLHQKIVGVGGE